MKFLKTAEINYIRQSTPYFIYRRLSGLLVRQFLYFTLPNGYGYWLRRIVSRWNESIHGDAVNFAPQIYVDFYARQNLLNRVPVPLLLLSSPGRQGEQFPGLVPPGTAPNGLEVTAAQRLSCKILDQFYPYNDTIHLEFTGQNPTIPLPAELDIMLEGYLVPEKFNRG